MRPWPSLAITVAQTFPDEPENGLLKLAQVAYEGAGTFAVSSGRTIKPLPVPVTGRVPGVFSDMGVR